MLCDGSCVAQIVSPSPAMMRAISSSGIGPSPLTWTAGKPISRIFFAVAARSAAFWQKSRTV
jgi:hypothetical protein